MSRIFGKKTTLMGLLAACILMVTASAAFATLILENTAPVVGWQTVNTLPARDAQIITLRSTATDDMSASTYDIATIDVLLKTTTSNCPVGIIPVTLTILDGAGVYVDSKTVNMANCVTRNVPFRFPGVGPVLTSGQPYQLIVSTTAPVAATSLSWAYSNNVVNPQIGTPLFDGWATAPFDFKFRIHV